MKALLLTAPSTLTFTDVPEPQIETGDVLVRVCACGFVPGNEDSLQQFNYFPYTS